MEVASVDVRIEQVTIYARGARVRRMTAISGTLPQQLRITGLPLSVIDDTVRVEVEGPAIATNVRLGVDAPAAAIEALEEPPELRGAKRRVALADAAVERIKSAIERIGASSIVAEDPSDEPPAAWAAIVTARRSVVALRAERELVLRASLAAAYRELDEARRAFDAVADRDRRGGTARPAKHHELRKHVEIELVANASETPNSDASSVTIHLEYLVAAARWAPSYVARLDGERVAVEIRAVVAQHTGEDWTSVPLRLSTAEPTRFAQLPELAAQRIGRRQHEPVRAGFRAPPVGAVALYADYDREVVPLRRRADELVRETRRLETDRGTRSATTEDATRKRPRTELGHKPDSFHDDHEVEQAAFGTRAGSAGFSEEVWDEDSSAAKEAFSTPASGSRMPTAPVAPSAVPMQAAPMRSGGRSKSIAPELARRLTIARGEGGAAAPEPPPRPAAPVPRLDYANLVMAPPSSSARGRLVPAPEDRHAIAAIVETADAKVAALQLPSGCMTDWLHTYDYAFATDGAVDVRADGAWHSIAVTAQASGARVHHVSVPREQADVFRIAAITNPFAGPLLPGPIDVYDHGRFLVTSALDYTPPGATVDIGLGVDAAVKIARNTEFHEETTGMLRGALRLHHTITIDVENVSGRSIELEVRERIPVTREGDDDVDVILGKVEPVWERWTPDPDAPRDQRLRGGHRWRLAVPAGQKRTLRALYEVKISGKAELVGGNRRES